MEGIEPPYCVYSESNAIVVQNSQWLTTRPHDDNFYKTVLTLSFLIRAPISLQ